MRSTASRSAADGTLTALVGPDGAGKTTLIRLVAGLLTADGGELKVLGIDVAARSAEVQDRIGYMPQRFGLYEDLTVQENLDLYADLHGVTAGRARAALSAADGDDGAGAVHRPAGRPAVGRHEAEAGAGLHAGPLAGLLLLDEPTVGVDPLSRRELWEIILQLVHEQGLTVLLSTSYLDEAERCGHVVVLHQGKVLAQGPPAEVSELAAGRDVSRRPPAGPNGPRAASALLDDPGVVDAVPEGGQVRFVSSSAMSRRNRERCPATARTRRSVAGRAATQPRFEDGFMVLLRQTGGAKPRRRHDAASSIDRPKPTSATTTAVDRGARSGAPLRRVHGRRSRQLRGPARRDLRPARAQRRRQDDDVSHALRPACRPRGGTLRVAGVDLRHARPRPASGSATWPRSSRSTASCRCCENLEFFASAYGLRGGRKRERIDWAMRQFELAPLARAAQRPTARRLQAAAGDGGGAAARAGDPVSRRADQRRRSAGPPRVLAADHRAGRAGRDGDRHHPLHGGGRVLRPRRHPGRRPRAGPGHAGRNPPPAHAAAAAASRRWKTPSSPSSRSARQNRRSAERPRGGAA